MRLHQPRTIIGCLVLILAAAASWGSETLMGDVGVTRFPGNQGAYGGSLTWQGASQLGGVLVGLSGTDYPVGALTVGSLDAYLIQSTRWMLSGGVSIGDATSHAGDSTLYKAHVAVDSRIDSQWSVRVADQYVDLDMIHGHLVNAGVQYRPSTRWDVSATAGYSVSGTLADRYGQLASNWYGAEHLFGGVVLGRTGYDPANLGESSVIRRLLQLYVGAGIPVRKGTFTVTADDTNLEGAARQTLRIGFIEPISP